MRRGKSTQICYNKVSTQGNHYYHENWCSGGETRGRRKKERVVMSCLVAAKCAVRGADSQIEDYSGRLGHGARQTSRGRIMIGKLSITRTSGQETGAC